MKKKVYIIAFTVLGILIQFLIHTGVEIWYIRLLLKDFDKYSLGLSWSVWYEIHAFSALILFLIGAIIGYSQGRHWWRIIYIKKAVKN